LTDNCNPSASVRAKLNWSTLQQRRKYNKAILTHKCLNNQLEGLDTNYLRHSEMHSHNTRNKDKFVLPKPRTEYMEITFKYLVSLYGTHYPKIFKTLILYLASKDKLVKFYYNNVIILLYSIVLMYS